MHLNRLEKNGRTKQEFLQIIDWLTGFDEAKRQALTEEKVTFRAFFEQSKMHHYNGQNAYPTNLTVERHFSQTLETTNQKI